MQYQLTDIYGHSPFPNDPELTKKWIIFLAKYLAISDERVVEHLGLIEKFKAEDINRLQKDDEKPKRTGRYLKPWTNLMAEEKKERQLEAAINYYAGEGEGEASFELAKNLVEKLDKQDKKVKSVGFFKWSKIWNKNLGLLQGIEEFTDLAVNPAAEIVMAATQKVPRAPRDELSDNLLGMFKCLIISTIPTRKWWRRDDLLATIYRKSEMPLSNSYKSQIAKIVDKLIIAFEKAKNASA